MSSYLFHSGNVITVDSSFTVTEAILVQDDTIIAVGNNVAVRQIVAAEPIDNPIEIDLAGRTLMPGFIDTHGHVALFGLDELKVPLNGAHTREEVLARLSVAVQAAATGEWIVAMPIGDPPYFLNANALRADGVVPSLAELDQLSPDNPIYIQAPTNRVPNFAVLNSAALRAAGIDANTRVSPHSQPELDENGALTGLLDGALQPIYNADPLYQMIEQVAPQPSYRDKRDGIAALAPKFAASGTTTILEAHLTDPEELRAYAELLETGQLPVRIFYTFEIDSRDSLAEIERFLRTVAFAANGGFGTARLKINGVSIGLDGPYWHGAACNDAAYMGPFGEMVDPAPLVDPAHYRAILELAADMGFRVHAEAAGRGSIELALRTFEAVNMKTPIRGKRYVLEHCEFPTTEQINTCAALGVAPTTSTNFIWGKGEEVYRQRLGDNYAVNAIPMRDWLDAGVPVAQSTDWGPHEPMFTLWQSLARRAGLSGEVIGEEQMITREEAIRAYTINGAWALKMEHELGSIEVGKRADLVILSGDPLTCPQDDIKQLDVELTMVDGQVVHGHAFIERQA